MYQVETKYRVWSIFMFIYGGFCILEVLSCMVNLVKSFDRGYYSWSYYSAYDYSVFVIALIIVTLMIAFAAFLNLHGGIALRRAQIKGRGLYIFYGVMSILGAVGIFLLILMSFVSSPAAAMLYLVFYLPGAILTAIMMFSKISGKKRQLGYDSSGGCVLFQSGEYAGKAVNLIQGQRFVLGSDQAQASLVLHDGKISPYHCVIDYDGQNGAYYVTDYSATGTFVNGQRLNMATTYTINPGSVVAVAEGGIQMMLQ